MKNAVPAGWRQLWRTVSVALRRYKEGDVRICFGCSLLISVSWECAYYHHTVTFLCTYSMNVLRLAFLFLRMRITYFWVSCTVCTYSMNVLRLLACYVLYVCFSFISIGRKGEGEKRFCPHTRTKQWQNLFSMQQQQQTLETTFTSPIFHQYKHTIW